MTDRERDALVGEKVMGLSVVGECWATTDWEGGYLLELEPLYEFDHQVFVYVRSCQCEVIRNSPTYDTKYDIIICGHFANCLEIVPSYSTDIAAAWKIVEKITKGNNWELTIETDSGEWEVRCNAHFSRKDYNERQYNSRAMTAPHAICLAALKAVGYEEPE